MKQPVPFGKYTLLERISVGGMAEVFRAKAFGVEGFERLVAVKRILPNIAEDKEFIRMFVDEAKLAVQLNHANIAQIADLGVVDGAYYIALEHVHGRDLRSVFERVRSRQEQMPVAQACFVAMKVCEGLDYAHNKRDQSGAELALVHRDVSPQNILVSFEGEVKIIDFGIAKAAGIGGSTQSGILKGKLGYMSPEQVRGLPVDRRSDIFSCGIVLYEMLTGERLFVGESDFSTLEKVRNVEILPPTQYNRKIPEDLERIVLRALARESEQRYQHAIDLHDDLQAFVYTAGEFCSRKDLAAWMKKTFSKEIEEETAKLEAYRQMTAPEPALPAHGNGVTNGRHRAHVNGASSSAPPIAPTGAARPSGAEAVEGSTPHARPSPMSAAPVATTPGVPSVPRLGTPASRAAAAKASAKDDDSPRRTRTMGSFASKSPPPPPPGRSQQMAAVVPAAPSASFAPASPSGPSGPSGPARTAQPPSQAVPTSSTKLLLVKPSDIHTEERTREDDLAEWDEEEELETQIYDNDFESAPVAKEPRPAASSRSRSASSQAAQAGQAAQAAQAGQIGRGQPAAAQSGTRSTAAPSVAASPPRAAARSEAPRSAALPAARAETPSVRATAEGWDLPRSAPAPTRQPPQAKVARAPEPAPAVPIPQMPSRPAPQIAHPVYPLAQPRDMPPELAADHRLIHSSQPAAEPHFAAIPTFGRGLLGRRPTSNRSLLALSLGGAALVIGGVALALTVGGMGARRQASKAPTTLADDRTGFDLYVVPAGITRWRLDGELRTDRLPSRIRGIAPGVHAVVIEAPPGFMSQSQNVSVASGQAPKVTIELPVMEITGHFQSDPEGANVTLIADGERRTLGVSPVSYKLDPRKAYQVLFEKPGFVSANRPVTLSGLERESIMVVLEKADGLGQATDPTPKAQTPPPEPKGPPVPVRPPVPTRANPPRVEPKVRPTERPRVEPKGVAPGEPHATKPPGEEPDPVISKEGTLQLGAKPPCEIEIDGKATGLSTPQREIILSVGVHRITLVNQEYSIRETFAVEIHADTPAKVVKDFSDRLPQ
jgi:eukaryotic-like serine/threonine-protein kinase